jgi:hypothetical protein
VHSDIRCSLASCALRDTLAGYGGRVLSPDYIGTFRSVFELTVRLHLMIHIPPQSHLESIPTIPSKKQTIFY